MATNEEMRDVVRSMIAQEDTLRDQRLGWLFALNGLLFAAVGFAWNDKDSVPLIVTLAALGVAVSVSVKVSLVASDQAVHALRAFVHVETYDPPVWGADYVELNDLSRKVYPWVAIPWFLALAWIAIAIARCAR